MTTSASFVLQSAIHRALRAHPPLMAMITAVADHVPRAQPFPYVVIGEDLVTDWSTKSFVGREHRITVHVWSQAPGHRVAKEILAEIEAALAEPVFDLRTADTAEHRLVSLRMLTARVLKDPDGLTHHGVLELRARTQSLI